MGQTAISRDVYYKDLRRRVSFTGQVTTTLEPAVRFTLSKPANRHSPIVRGWREPLPWTMTETQRSAYMLGADVRRGTNSYYGVTSEVPSKAWSDYVGVNTTRLESQTIIKALNNMRQNAVNLGVAFGERRETARTVGDTALRLTRAVRELRKGNLRSFRTLLGARPGSARNARTRQQAREIAERVPSIWLEHQYAWKPLLSDVHTAIDRSIGEDYRDPTRTWATVKAQVTERLDGARTYPINLDGGLVYDCVDRENARGFIRIDYRPDSDWAHLKDAEEWGILNPAVVAWELVPFSFVVDWFAPVGDYLNAMSATIPYKFKAGSFTLFRDISVQMKGRITGRPSNRSFTYVSNDTRGWYTAKVMSRKVYSSFPYPSLEGLLGHAQSASDQSVFTRAANALSILASVFSSR